MRIEIFVSIVRQCGEIVSRTRGYAVYLLRVSEFQRITMNEFRERNDADTIVTHGCDPLDFLRIIIARSTDLLLGITNHQFCLLALA